MQLGAKTVFQFSVYEVDAESRELRKSGVRIRLTDQAFQLLVALLERPGEMVSREEMKQRLWPQDTFVDFDHGLNSAINRLRDALNDSASSPRYIETLARRGYRFLLPVEVRERAQTTSSTDPVNGTKKPLAFEQPDLAANVGSDPTISSISILTQPEELPKVRRFRAQLLFLLIQVMYLVFYVVALARLQYLDAVVEQAFGHDGWISVLTLVSALVGLPVRLYLISGVAFGVSRFSQKFRRMFVPVFVIDELWSLSPLLLTAQLGIGLALGATAALIYVPFAERTLLLMADRPSTS